jgi:hypothetical protein
MNITELVSKVATETNISSQQIKKIISSAIDIALQEFPENKGIILTIKDHSFKIVVSSIIYRTPEGTLATKERSKISMREQH